MKNNLLIPTSLLAVLLALPSIVMAAPSIPTAHHGQSAVAVADDESDDGDMQDGDMQEEDTAATDEAEASANDSESDTNVNTSDASPAPLNQQHNNPDYQPLIQGEVNTGNITPAQLAAQPAPITLQEKKKDRRGELVATQPGEVEMQENRRYTAH